LEPFKVENWRCMQLANCPHSPPRHRGENWNGVKVNPMRFNKSYVFQHLYVRFEAYICLCKHCCVPNHLNFYQLVWLKINTALHSVNEKQGLILLSHGRPSGFT
jgi:hypothetical protein